MLVLMEMHRSLPETTFGYYCMSLGLSNAMVMAHVAPMLAGDSFHGGMDLVYNASYFVIIALDVSQWAITAAFCNGVFGEFLISGLYIPLA